MLRWLARRRIAAFERRHGYDASYLREIVDESLRAAVAFGRIEGMAHYCRRVPLDAYFAAKLVAALSEDCGPCTQLVVPMAERAGIHPAVLRAVVVRDEQAMTADGALGFRFAEAVLAHDPAADGLREAVLQRWGRHALISLAFAIAAARVYPAVKYALGHGHTCLRVTVGGTPMPVLRRAA